MIDPDPRWTPTGQGDDGTQTFSIVDDDGTEKNFGFDPDGNFFWLPDTAPAEPAAAPEPARTAAPPPLIFGDIHPAYDPTVSGPFVGPVYVPPPPPPEPETSYVYPGADYQPEPVGEVTSIDTDEPEGHPGGTMTTYPDSLIDEAGWEVVWELNEDGSFAVAPHYGRPPVTHQTWDSAGQQKIWEVAYNGDGPYNLRNGGTKPTSGTDAATGRPLVWDIDPNTGDPVNVRFADSPPPANTGGGTTNPPPSNGGGYTPPPNTGGGSTPPPDNTNTNTGGGGYTTQTTKRFTHPVSGVTADIPIEWVFVTTTAAGNAVFQLRDAAGTVKQWEVDRDMNFLQATFRNAVTLGVYSPPAGGGGGVTVPPPAATTYPVTHPVTGVTANVPSEWLHVGSTAAGNPVFQLRDADGVVKQWELDGAMSYIPSSLRNAVTLGVYSPPPAGGGGTVTIPPPSTNIAMVQFQHPVTGQVGSIPERWRRVGTDASGNPVFQVLDEAGVTKQFTLDTNFQAVGMITVPSYGVYVPVNGGTAVTATATKSNALLGVAIVGFGVWLYMKNTRQRNPAPRRSRRR